MENRTASKPIVYNVFGKKDNIIQLNEKFGKRPGDKRVDPYWFRANNYTGKVDLWNTKTKTWQRILPGQAFNWNEDGEVVCVSN